MQNDDYGDEFWLDDDINDDEEPIEVDPKPSPVHKIKCEVCGSSNIIKRNGIFVCQSCGAQYTTEEIRKQLNPDHKETAKKAANTSKATTAATTQHSTVKAPVQNTTSTSSKSATTSKNTTAPQGSHQNTTQKSSSNGGCIGGLIVVIIIVILLGVACSNSMEDSNDEYRRTLESGQQKYYNGEQMNREEYNAVKGFNDWESKQGEHTYNEWDN